MLSLPRCNFIYSTFLVLLYTQPTESKQIQLEHVEAVRRVLAHGTPSSLPLTWGKTLRLIARRFPLSDSVTSLEKPCAQDGRSSIGGPAVFFQQCTYLYEFGPLPENCVIGVLAELPFASHERYAWRSSWATGNKAYIHLKDRMVVRDFTSAVN